jgi:hypothetical protein
MSNLLRCECKIDLRVPASRGYDFLVLTLLKNKKIIRSRYLRLRWINMDNNNRFDSKGKYCIVTQQQLILFSII